MKIFIGGSKSVGKLTPKVKKMLAAIIKKDHHILIGDCYGTDLAVQRFLSEQGYQNVTVYTACGVARNNAGGWMEIIVNTEKTGFYAHREKDIAMAKSCDCGIMIWNGKSRGASANIEYLKSLGRKVVVINETI